MGRERLANALTVVEDRCDVLGIEDGFEFGTWRPRFDGTRLVFVRAKRGWGGVNFFRGCGGPFFIRGGVVPFGHVLSRDVT